MQNPTRLTAAFALAVATFALAANSFALPVPKTVPMPKCPTRLGHHAGPTPGKVPMPKCPTSLR